MQHSIHFPSIVASSLHNPLSVWTENLRRCSRTGARGAKSRRSLTYRNIVISRSSWIITNCSDLLGRSDDNCHRRARLCLCGIAAPNGPIVHTPHYTWVNIKQRWNDTDRENRKDSEKSVIQWYFKYHEFRVECHGSESRLRDGKLATNRLCYGTAEMMICYVRWWFLSVPPNQSVSHCRITVRSFVIFSLVTYSHIKTG
jgi:hypothetical protein